MWDIENNTFMPSTVPKSSFEIIYSIFPNQANGLYNLMLSNPETFRTLYPDLAVLLPDFNRLSNPPQPPVPTPTPTPTTPNPAEVIRKRLVVVSGTEPTTYKEGFFQTQPVKEYGAVPRLMVALARKKPDNGWAWYALAFERFVCFESYWPATCV